MCITFKQLLATHSQSHSFSSYFRSDTSSLAQFSDQITADIL